MAIYRLFKSKFDQSWRPLPPDAKKARTARSSSGHGSEANNNVSESTMNRKGVSSGLSTVIKRVGKSTNNSSPRAFPNSSPNNTNHGKTKKFKDAKDASGTGTGKKWWDELPGVDAIGAISKGSMKLKVAPGGGS